MPELPELTNKPRTPEDITPEKLKADYIEYGPVPNLAKYYGVPPRLILAMAKEYKLSLQKLSGERVCHRIKKEYDEFVAKLGHHPTGHEMLQNKESIKLYGAIRRLFGSFARFKETYGYPSPPDPFIAKANDLYKDYLLLGTLAKVAKKHKLTVGTVGHNLRRASAQGLFKYPPEKPDPLSCITPEKLKADYMLYGSIGKVAKHYGVPSGKIANLIKKYKLSPKKLITEIAKREVPADYMKITKKLGHHPSATELQHFVRGLYNRIIYHYKSITTFRKKYGYPMHEKGSSKLSDHSRRLYNSNRKTILEYLKAKSGTTSFEIANASGIGYATVLSHLAKLIKEGIVYRVKKGLFRCYFLKQDGKIKHT